jgi:hypothetical protein
MAVLLFFHGEIHTNPLFDTSAHVPYDRYGFERMDTTVWSIVEYQGRLGLERLETDWRRLSSDLPVRSRYHAFEAQMAYLDHLCADPSGARYLALEDGDGVVRAICPLEPASDLSLRRPLRAWALPSHDHWLAVDALAPDDEAQAALLPAVVCYLRSRRKGRGLLLLGPMRQDSPLWASAARLEPRMRCLHDTHPSASFDCMLSYEQLLERMSKHFRRNLRANRNKMLAAGEVQITTVSSTTDPEGLAAEFENFLAIEASGWKGGGGAASAIGLRPHLVAFYRDIMARMTGPEDRCEINSLYLDGRCIAAQFCMRTSSEYTILKIAYDEAFARMGPGQFLFQTTVERCCSDPGIDSIDLITDAGWMRDWRTDLMPMGQAHIALSPVWGTSLIALLRFRHGPARRLVARYRDSGDAARKPAKVGRRSVAHERSVAQG